MRLQDAIGQERHPSEGDHQPELVQRLHGIGEAGRDKEDSVGISHCPPPLHRGSFPQRWPLAVATIAVRAISAPKIQKPALTMMRPFSSTTSDSVVGTKVHSTRKDQEGDRCRQHLIHPAEGSALDSEPMFDREKAIATIEAGRCPCPGCAGALTEDKLSARGWRHCRVCRCGWKVENVGKQRYAASIMGPVHAPPRQPIRQLTEADYDGHDDLEVGDSRFP